MDSAPVDTGFYVVRYGATRQLGDFNGRSLPPLARQTAVIIRSERGVEWGTVLCPATKQTRSYLGNTGEPGRILRLPSPEDEERRDNARAKEKLEFATCAGMIRDHHLQMQLIDVEHLMTDDRVIFYYLAEGRVDFRELVKTLAKELQVRVEMRQIGIRDEAKLLADYGDCGKPVCCNTHLTEMPPVSMKMAKLQKATLDPTKISGRCGRLKCCLRYEYDTYEEYRRELPPIGAMVVTKAGQGKVIAQEILSKKLMIAFDGARQSMVDLKEVLTVISRGGGKKNTDQTTEKDDEAE